MHGVRALPAVARSEEAQQDHSMHTTVPRGRGRPWGAGRAVHAALEGMAGVLYCSTYCQSCRDRLALFSFAFNCSRHENLIGALLARFCQVGSQICTWVPRPMQRYCGGTATRMRSLNTPNRSP